MASYGEAMVEDVLAAMRDSLLFDTKKKQEKAEASLSSTSQTVKSSEAERKRYKRPTGEIFYRKTLTHSLRTKDSSSSSISKRCSCRYCIISFLYAMQIVFCNFILKV